MSEIDIDEDDPEEVPKDYKTFDQWKKFDRVIARGEKATWFDGKAYFHRSQTFAGGDFDDD